MTNLATVSKFQTKAGKAIEDFLYEISKKSSNTEIAYRGDIKAFLDKVYEKSIDTITAEELELLDYDLLREYLDGYYKVKSNAVINRYLSSIKSLYRKLNAHKVIKTDLAFFDLIEALPNTPESYEVMPMEVALQYIKATQNEKNKPKEKEWFLKLAIETALRLDEMFKLQWSQFKVDGDRVYIAGFGKGNVKYLDVISKDFYNQLLEIKVEGQQYVFTINKKNITDMMKRLKNELGHDDRKYVFHSLKKTAVTNTKKYTGSTRAAQKKGRHTYMATTERYLEEEELVMSGYFSLEGKINHNLYKEVSHEQLIQALQGMNKELLFSLNLKLQGE